MESLNLQQEILFYDKHTNFTLLNQYKLFQAPDQYPLYLTQNEVLPNELAIANTDFSIQLLDMEKQVHQPFQQSDFHHDKINALKFTNMHDSEYLQHVLFSASQDGGIKIWDRRSGSAVNTLKYNGKPFFSVDSNKLQICGGTNSELIFWDLRKMKVVNNYQSSHTDDVTAIHYHAANPNWLLTSSTDNLVCHFDFENKPSTQEDDTMESVYASDQPLIDCGFINKEMFWCQTTVNTIEVVTIENCEVFSKIQKFPHKVDYVISAGQDRFTGKFVIYCGNNQGEVYIYDLSAKDKLELVDMILLGQDTIIRNCMKVANDVIALSTESGDVRLFKYNPEQGQSVIQNIPQIAMEMPEEDMEDDGHFKSGNQKKKNGKFKPF